MEQDKKWDLKLEGVKNQLKLNKGAIQWVSFSFETGFTDKKLDFVSAHLWLFGFQLFEFSIYRRKKLG